MTVSATLGGVLLKGTAASRPAANAVSGGTVYSATDTGAITQSDGSSWSTFATISSGLADPMTTRGDLIARNASNVTSRLGVGAAGKILSSDGTDVTWGNGPLTTQDDIIVGGAAGIPTRLAKGTDGQVLTVDPVTHHLVWATPSGGGGGITQAFVGYNTIGGTWETPAVNSIEYFKQVTLANDCLLTSIGGYFQTTAASTAGGPHAALLTDIAGVPGSVIAESRGELDVLLAANTGRWIDLPIGAWVVAGTYWLNMRTTDSGFVTALQIAYDGSGSDVTATGTAGLVADGSQYTRTTGSRKYSIRANTIR